MTTERPLLSRLLDYLLGITTWKQVAILVVLGAALLLGVLLYQHPRWIENSWRYRHGLPLHEESP